MANTAKVREEIANILRNLVIIRQGKDALYTIWLKEADSILALPDILVKAEDQKYPKIPEIPVWWGSIGTYQEGQMSMSRAVFIKVEAK